MIYQTTFNPKPLDDPRYAPSEITLTIGRFEVGIVYDSSNWGGISWAILKGEEHIRMGTETYSESVKEMKLDEATGQEVFTGKRFRVQKTRPAPEFPSCGKINTSDGAVGPKLMLLLSEVRRYAEFLDVQDEIKANPEKYAKLAKEAEEAAEKERLAAEKAAKAEAERLRKEQEEAEKERLAALEAEREAEEQAAIQRSKEELQARLARRMHEIAAREVQG